MLKSFSFPSSSPLSSLFSSPFVFSLFLILYFIITPNITYLKILWKMEHLSFGASAPFSKIFSKVFKTEFIFFLFFSILSKIENEVMI